MGGRAADRDGLLAHLYKSYWPWIPGSGPEPPPLMGVPLHKSNVVAGPTLVLGLLLMNGVIIP